MVNQLLRPFLINAANGTHSIVTSCQDVIQLLREDCRLGLPLFLTMITATRKTKSLGYLSLDAKLNQIADDYTVAFCQTLEIKEYHPRGEKLIALINGKQIIQGQEEFLQLALTWPLFSLNGFRRGRQ